MLTYINLKLKTNVVIDNDIIEIIESYILYII